MCNELIHFTFNLLFLMLQFGVEYSFRHFVIILECNCDLRFLYWTLRFCMNHNYFKIKNYFFFITHLKCLCVYILSSLVILLYIMCVWKNFTFIIAIVINEGECNLLRTRCCEARQLWKVEHVQWEENMRGYTDDVIVEILNLLRILTKLC